ncbi:MAG: GntR family transcriptional regulator [Desulfobacteraceae bacterium]|nr:MAG: GntR family transcriptional regulator [Desulfobacteraceae bacterium]
MAGCGSGEHPLSWRCTGGSSGSYCRFNERLTLNELIWYDLLPVTPPKIKLKMMTRTATHHIVASKSPLPLRPAQFATNHLISGILNGIYPSGSHLPNERMLSQQLGITRPTLRETLQRLAQEGWITIAHGKPTIVNDYWQTGGLSLLGRLAQHSDLISNGFVIHLLGLRQNLMPTIAAAAAARVPALILKQLADVENLADDPVVFSAFDWRLQLLMVRHCGNPVYTLLFNDFTPLYHKAAALYFRSAVGREASRRYYRRLQEAVHSHSSGIAAVVEAAMQESLDLWKSGLEEK